jgi:hypothetical protein
VIEMQTTYFTQISDPTSPALRSEMAHLKRLLAKGLTRKQAFARIKSEREGMKAYYDGIEHSGVYTL